METLDYFFISKVRIKILKLFYNNPDAGYHVRGVVREVEEEINAVRRELMRLEKAKLLKSERKGNRLYFHMRKDFVFYYELFSIIHKSFGLGKAIIKIKDKAGDIKFALLTDSYIEKLKTPHKDVDLLIVGNVESDKLNEVVKGQQENIGREINYTYMGEEEFNLRKRRNDVFVTGILRGKKIMLVGLEDDLVN